MTRLIPGSTAAIVLLAARLASADEPPAAGGQAAAGGGASSSTVSAPQAEGEPSESGLSLGLRLGYGIGLGEAAEGSSLSDTVSGHIPIILDVGYRGLGIPNLYLGAFATWGPAFIADKACPSPASCSGSIVRLGANARWHFMPSEKLDPYAGLGLGYEIVNFSVESGAVSADASYKGFEFFELQGGLDYKVMPALRLGPFVNFAMAQYSTGTVTLPNGTSVTGDITKTAMHEWLIFGVRGQYDLF